MTGTDTHECPRTGCGRNLPRHLLACKPHWYQVPKHLRDDVNRTWRSGDLGAYLEAREAAVEALNGDDDGHSVVRVLLAVALALALVYDIAWFGRAGLIAAGLVLVLLVVCTTLAIAGGWLRDRIARAAAARRRQRVLDEFELEQVRAWARSETELLPAGMTDRLWAEVSAELERRRRDAS